MRFLYIVLSVLIFNSASAGYLHTYQYVRAEFPEGLNVAEDCSFCMLPGYFEEADAIELKEINAYRDAEMVFSKNGEVLDSIRFEYDRTTGIYAYYFGGFSMFSRMRQITARFVRTEGEKGVQLYLQYYRMGMNPLYYNEEYAHRLFRPLK